MIDQAIFRFAPAGLPIKLRTLQKYCLNGKIRATLAVTDKNTFKYFLDPTSIDEFIAREAEKTPTENGEADDTIAFLDPKEIEAMLNVPDVTKPQGRRDRAIIHSDQQ